MKMKVTVTFEYESEVNYYPADSSPMGIAALDAQVLNEDFGVLMMMLKDA
jgi:hypothetical protein